MNCRMPGSSVHKDSPGKNTGEGCDAFFQGIFPTQGLNPSLHHCRWILYVSVKKKIYIFFSRPEKLYIGQTFAIKLTSYEFINTYWINPSNKYAGFISFKAGWFDLFAVLGTLEKSSPTSQFKGINSSVLSLPYGPTFTSIHDYWKNHSFDYMDLCQQSNV